MDIYTQSPLLPMKAKKKKYWRKLVYLIVLAVILTYLMIPKTQDLINNISIETEVEALSQESDRDIYSHSVSIPITLQEPKTLNLTPIELVERKSTEEEVNDEVVMMAGDPEWDMIRVKPGDSLTRIFSKLRLSNRKLHEILGIKSIEEHLSNIKPGQSIHFLVDPKCKSKTDTICNLSEMKMPISDSMILHIVDNNGDISHDVVPIETRMAYAEGIITDSLYESAAKSGLSDKTIVQLTQIFGWDIDFALDMRENDSFKVLYEDKYINGKKVSTGDIVSAEFTNQGQTYQAVRHIDEHKRTKYYTPEGMSLQKAFLRTPVNFTRISSHFSTGRKHPILHKIRAHKGVDYAAPTGTPVKSSGDGKIIFSGKKGGYGNTVIIQHGPKYSTLYGHLSKFNSKARSGSFVKQGQIIGYVGMTGLASGPHLHYEFRVNGVHRNPLTVKLPDAAPIGPMDKKEFLASAKNMLNLMEAHRRIEISKYDG